MLMENSPTSMCVRLQRLPGAGLTAAAQGVFAEWMGEVYLNSCSVSPKSSCPRLSPLPLHMLLSPQCSSLCVSPAENPSVAPSRPRTEPGLSDQPAEAPLSQTLPPSLTTHAPSRPPGHPSACHPTHCDLPGLCTRHFLWVDVCPRFYRGDSYSSFKAQPPTPSPAEL